ncbi:MAG: hypothetical protein O2866_00675 [archaeon]|nr:hypothetical protein [archaeon]MDA1167381.1 hypothetical protein [archaeon]
MAKKEHAQRVLDALETSKRLKVRSFVVSIVLLLLGVIAFFQEFNLTLILGVELLLFVFLSFSIDRQRQLVEYNIDLGFKKLGWSKPEKMDEEMIRNLKKIVGVEEK